VEGSKDRLAELDSVGRLETTSLQPSQATFHLASSSYKARKKQAKAH